MAIIKPFRALRPVADKAQQVSCGPYDVVYESEVRTYIEKNPLSFLRVTRAEGEFPENEAPAVEAIFGRARENLETFIEQNIYQTDPDDALYVYQLSGNEHSQTGVVGCCSLDEYESGVIKRHENVRPDKVKDRTGHMLAVGAQTGLIFLAFRGTDETQKLIADAVKHEPLYDFYCLQGIRQRVWRIKKTGPWVNAFAQIPNLYIADGHHRIESAKLARDAKRAADPHHTGREEYDYVVAGMFPAGDLRILPYNRIVTDLNGLSSAEFAERLKENFSVDDNGDSSPDRHGDICMYLDGVWRTLRPRTPIDGSDPIERLDVSILQRFILDPILGIEDARTDQRIGFVGGVRGIDELVRLVDAGAAAVAFSLFPTTMDDLFAVSDMDGIMPPKSTWFEPKLKDGLLVHTI